MIKWYAFQWGESNASICIHSNAPNAVSIKGIFTGTSETVSRYDVNHNSSARALWLN